MKSRAKLDDLVYLDNLLEGPVLASAPSWEDLRRIVRVLLDHEERIVEAEIELAFVDQEMHDDY